MPFNNTDIISESFYSQYTFASVTEETHTLASVSPLVSIWKRFEKTQSCSSVYFVSIVRIQTAPSNKLTRQAQSVKVSFTPGAVHRSVLWVAKTDFSESSIIRAALKVHTTVEI